MAVRPKPGVWEYVRVNVDEMTLDELTVSEYLGFKELLVDESYIISISSIHEFLFQNFTFVLMDRIQCRESSKKQKNLAHIH